MDTFFDFDFNINNYKIIELEKLFKLPNNYNYQILINKEQELKDSINNSNNINIELKKKTLIFINEVKHYLTNNLINEVNEVNINNINYKNNKENEERNKEKEERYKENEERNKENERNNTNNQRNNKNNIIASKLTELNKTYKDIYNYNNQLLGSNTINEGGTNIILPPKTPFTTSYPSEYFEGIINPLHKRILRQNLNIDTRFRNNYYSTISSNIHINLPLKFRKVVSMQLTALEFPNTFYSISKIFDNNFFVIEIENYSSLLITIPDGNYDYNGLTNYINSFLSASSAPYNSIACIINYKTPNGTGSASGSGSMIFSLKTGTSPSFNFALNFLTDKNGNKDNYTPLPLKMGWIMGFREGYYVNNTNYVSEGIVDLVGPKYIYLIVDDFNNNVNDSFYGAFNNSILNKNILARISLQGSVFNVMSQNNLLLITTPRQYFGPVDIQKLQIQLLDEYGRILNLNNMDYSFCLTFQTIYDL